MTFLTLTDFPMPDTPTATAASPDPQPTLRTERLVLRPFQLKDAPDVQRYAGAREVAAMTLKIPHPYLDGMAETWIATLPEGWTTRTRVTWAIVTPEDALRGAIMLVLDLTHRSAELGYWIGMPFWGLGLATEAAAAVVEFAFRDLELNRVQACHLPQNGASGRVLAKVGMVREGLYRERYFRDGRFQDSQVCGILRREWEARRS